MNKLNNNNNNNIFYTTARYYASFTIRVRSPDIILYYIWALI